jgi:uncharacterized protein (DUF736 family)
MVQDQKPVKQPDYKGKLDVAAWVNLDKNGKTYLSVKIANNVNLFKNEPKPQQPPKITSPTL